MGLSLRFNHLPRGRLGNKKKISDPFPLRALDSQAFKFQWPLSVLLTLEVSILELLSELWCQVRALGLGPGRVLTPSQLSQIGKEPCLELQKEAPQEEAAGACAEASEDGGKSEKSDFAQGRSFLVCACCLSTNPRKPVYKTNPGIYISLGSFLLPLRKA